jgi:uncharacterized delta-60 repeat protein
MLLTELFLLIAAGTAGFARAAPADLDPTFGVGGIVVVPPPGPIPGLEVGPNRPAAVTVQPDGKILLAVEACNSAPIVGCFRNPFALIRYNSNGSVDSNFGASGVVTGLGQTQVFAILAQADGKIVLLGGAQGSYWLMRLDGSGVPDTSFGNSGTTTVALGMFVDTLLQQADGKLLLGGISEFANFATVAVARFNVDGSADLSYGSGGIASQAVTRDRQASIDDFAGVRATLQSDGKVVVVGDLRNTVHGYDIFVARFDTRGHPDPTFAAGDGVVETSFTATAMHNAITATRVRQQSDAKLLVVGTQATLPDFASQVGVLQLNPDGSIDDSFGTYGRVVVRTTSRVANMLTAQWSADDYVLLVGTDYHPQSAPISGLITRIAPDGSLDPGFGDCGAREFDEASYQFSTFVVGQQPDGKLIVSGFALPAAVQASNNQFALGRLQGNHSTTVFVSDDGPNPAKDGESVALTARVVGAAPFSSTVTFMDGGVPIPSCTAVPVTASDSTNATASCVAGNLALGSHVLSATYDGEPVNPRATSCPIAQFVDQSDRTTAIEYYNDVVDDYFVTTLPAEVAALESGLFRGWSRTGQSFQVHPIDQLAGSAPVCRFFSGESFTPVLSHFLTPLPDECAAVEQDRHWIFEGQVFGIDLPSYWGYCPAGQIPLYRMYNNGQGGVPNHRYLIDQEAADALFNDGWVFEGSGNPGTIGCVWN